MKEEAQTLTALIRSAIATRRRVVNLAVKTVQVLSSIKTRRKISIRTYRTRYCKHKIRKRPTSQMAVRKTLRCPLTLK